MSAVYVSNLVINTGTTFAQTFTLEDSDSNSVLDLTGYSIQSTMKKHPASLKETCSFDASVLNATQGIIKVGLSSVSCRPLKGGRYVYDVLITDGSGTVTRVVEGSVLVRAGVTTHFY